MRPRLLLLFATVAMLALVACGPDDGRDLAEPSPDLTAVPVPTTTPAEIIDLDPALQTTGPRGLTLDLIDNSAGATLPPESGCEGAVSPGLRWTEPPPRTAEMALVVQDVDSDGSVPWLVTGIPPSTLEAPAGNPPAGGEVRVNSTGTATWASPCPQDGFAHRIVFTLYVLDRPLPEVGGDVDSVVAAVRDAAFGEATVLGRAAPGVTD